MIGALGPLVTQLMYLVCAACALALGGWLLARRKDRGPAAVAMAAALALTAGWALACGGLGAAHAGTAALLSLSYLAWLWTLYRLFAHDQRDKSVAPIRPVVFALAFVEIMQLVLLAGAHSFSSLQEARQGIVALDVTFRLLFCVGALVLVHNLYAGASAHAREALRWPAAALAAIWLYDLNLSTVAYLGQRLPIDLVVLRGTAMLAAVALLAIGSLRHDGNLRFNPSRSFAFRSFSLLIIGGYLVIMVLVAQGLAYLGSDLARLVQPGFLVLAGAVALTVLPSRRLRGWLRVTLSKHLFQHRYDYRAEWLRFTDTMGRAGPAAAPLRERIVQAVADITDSPGGLLLAPREEGGMALEARWQWPEIEVPAEALPASAMRFVEASQFIVDFDDLRAGLVEAIPIQACPDWLMNEEAAAWAMVPLLHFERLVGVVVLARPPLARRLDWEDFDLLRVVGRQLASYLAEQASQDALGEAMRFDEFNRRIAFVMHDIKNLASQLALLARNAEKHADNPEFRADMLVTLRNSAEKLQALLARLGRYGAHGRDAPEPVVLGQLLARVAARYSGLHEVVVIERAPCEVLVDRESLEQALVHLVQNAIEASSTALPVFLDLRVEDARAIVGLDSGSGMSPEFIRTRLFKPFHSSKPGGFGIGAFEARELIRAMGGRLDVESREELGTRFRILLPLAGAAGVIRSLQSHKTEVA